MGYALETAWFSSRYPAIIQVKQSSAVNNNDAVIAGVVANWLHNKGMEIRHIAVHQRRSIGRRLMETMKEMVEMNVPVRIQTYARNT